MPITDAKIRAAAAGLWLRGPETGGGPVVEADWPTGVITAQAPEPGAVAEPGSALAAGIDRNDQGRGGVRGPRRPRPDPIGNAEQVPSTSLVR